MCYRDEEVCASSSPCRVRPVLLFPVCFHLVRRYRECCHRRYRRRRLRVRRAEEGVGEPCPFWREKRELCAVF